MFIAETNVYVRVAVTALLLVFRGTELEEKTSMVHSLLGLSTHYEYT